MPDEKPMDEFEWEEWLKKNDEMVDKYSALMDKYMDDPNRDEIIAKEMGWDKDTDDDGIERPWLKEFEESLEHIDEVEEGDEWKVTAGIKTEDDDDIPDIEDDPLYQRGFSFATDFMKWFDVLPERIQKDDDMLEAARNAAIPAAKIAGATGIGGDDDKDQLGMRLAVYKRGLAAANKTVSALTTAKEKNLFNEQSLTDFIKRATELRNALAVRIQEVRDRFSRL